MKNFFILLFSGVLITTAQNKYSIGIDLSIMDKSVDPRNDLARFANGKWLDNTSIPESDYAWGSFSEIRERNEKNLHAILLEIASDKTAKPGSDRKKMQDLWLSAMDSVGRNKSGITPLKAELAAIDAIKTKADLFKVIGRLQKNGLNCVFNFSVEIDMKDSKRNRPYLAQGGIGLPSRDFYLMPNYAVIQEEYKKHMSRTFELMKFYPESAQSYAARAYAIEKKLAEGCMGMVELRNVDAQYNKMGIAEIKKLSPSVNYDLYFASLGIKTPDTLIVMQPAFYANLSKMIDSIPLSSWKNYLKWFTVHEFQPFLSDDHVQEHFSFYGRILQGSSKMKPRWKKSVAAVDMAMGEALGKIFVEKHFNDEAKRRVNEMVDNLIAAFKERINNRPWMSEETKTAAIQKLDKIYRKLGFPEKWEDYSKMKIGKVPFVTNMIAVNNWKVQQALAKLNAPPDKSKWGMSPPTVNAYYNPSTNEIAFPAGIMQPPFFDPQADDAFNYGIMGAVIGHELSHGFDDEGSKFDGDGNFVTWWAKDDIEKFEQRTKVLVQQFDGYVAIDTFHVRGKLTLGENIADLGGLTMAYYAYKRSLNGKPSEVREGFTGEQRFFIAWAQGWRIKMRDEYLKQMVATNPHSPGLFRAIGPPSNMPEFYEAFGVKEGDKMFRPKELRAEIW